MTALVLLFPSSPCCVGYTTRQWPNVRLLQSRKMATIQVLLPQLQPAWRRISPNRCTHLDPSTDAAGSEYIASFLDVAANKARSVSAAQSGPGARPSPENFQTGGSRDLGRFHLPDGVRFDGCADICGDLVACVLLRDRETLVLLANWCAGKFLVFGAWALYETPFALFPGHIILGFSHMPSSAIDHLNVYPVPSLDSLWRSASVFDLEDTIDASRIDASSLNLSIINNPTPRPFPESHHGDRPLLDPVSDLSFDPPHPQ
ncbi:hypothetical protein B0H11DRAFT_2291470 [Mycena galericulata]|nr:hypothetical protein B0H11DRAFT_2291470 [Mycena galericulata]